jgi:hypothetical protein
MRPEKGESEEDVRKKCRQWGGTPKKWESDGIVSGIMTEFLRGIVSKKRADKDSPR